MYLIHRTKQIILKHWLSWIQQVGVAIQRFDMLKYKQFDKLTDKQLGFFWRPEEVDVTKDSNDLKILQIMSDIFSHQI